MARRVGSISFGYIGDNAVGTEPAAPYREPTSALADYCQFAEEVSFPHSPGVAG